MRFRLTYDGPLQAKQRDSVSSQKDPTAGHTHSIRKVFHGQLRRLWDTNRFLREADEWEKDFAEKGRHPDRWARFAPDPIEIKPIREMVPNLYKENGYRFLPLVREDWELYCDLDILFLRNDAPGGVIHAGDIDNRVKTLIDALRKPNNAAELAGNEKPTQEEDPFYVLLEDDKNVTSLTVETDTLLDPDMNTDNRNVSLVITVDIRPYHATTFNMGFL
jgi:hypothetical protein